MVFASTLDRWLRPVGLRARLLGAFLLLSVLPLSAVGVLVYRQGEALLKRELWDRLTAVALLKSQQLETWVNERRNDVLRPASIPVFQRELATFVRQPGTPSGGAAERQIREIIDRIRAAGKFAEMFVVEPRAGQVVLSTDPGQEGKFKRDRPYFREGRKGPFLQHVYYSLALAKPVMAVSAPVLDPAGQLVGILVGRVDLRFLDRLMAERSGLGLTGQTFLVNRFNYFVSDSLGRGQDGWRPVFSEGAKRALAGESGTAVYVNHAGRRVVAAYRWIQAPGLALIAEMDEEEAFAPIRAFRLALVVMLSVVAAAAIAVGAALSFGISRPVGRLAEAARAIGEGRLDQQVEVRGPVELATLARSFNAMAEGLAQFQRTQERRVVDRTEELATLSRLAEATAEAGTIEQLLDPALDRILTFLQGDVGLAYLPDEESAGLVLTAHRGLPPHLAADLSGNRVAPGDGLVGEVGASGRLILLQEAADDLRAVAAIPSELGIGALVAFPLTTKALVVGVIVLGTARGKQIPGDRLTFLEVLGSQLGAVVENLRLRERAAAQSREFQALAAITRELTSLRGADHLLQQIIAQASDLLRAEGVGLRVLEGDDLVLAARTDPAADVTRRERIKLGEGLSGRVFSEGRPIAISDLGRDPRQLPGHGERTVAAGFRSFLGVPLRAQDRALGTLNIYTKRRRVFTDYEVTLLSAFADQAAIAIENARLYESLAQKHEHLSELLEVARRAAMSLTPSDVLPTLARAAASFIGHDAATIRLLDASGTVLQAVAHHGVSEAFANRGDLRVGEGVMGRVVVDGRPATVADLAAEAQYVHRELALAEGLRAMVVVPLRSRERTIGILCTYARAPRCYREAEVESLSRFANVAAVAIENARLYAEAQTRSVRLKRLAELSDQVNSSLDLQQVLEFVSEAARDLLRSDLARLWVLDEPSSTLRLRAQAPRPAGVPAPMTAAFARGVGAVSWVVEHKTGYRSSSLLDDPRFVNKEWARANGYVSTIIAPLLLGERAIGALAIFTRSPRRFGAEEEELLQLFASKAALALDNARLYADAQTHAAALQAKNAELDSFVYSVSHDLKAPLVTLEGMAGLLIEDCGPHLTGDGRRYLDRIQANVQQMERLISDLLALSRIGRDARPQEAVNTAELLDELRAEMAGTIDARGVKVVVRDATTLWGIRTQLQQVFANLLGNAIKYSTDTPSPVVEIGTVDRGAVVECYVRDNGIGIDPAYHERIFEIFQRLKEVEAEGTGVGLAIVKKIVETAGGRIWVESARGQGATFRFTWPKRAGARQACERMP